MVLKDRMAKNHWILNFKTKIQRKSQPNRNKHMKIKTKAPAKRSQNR